MNATLTSLWICFTLGREVALCFNCLSMFLRAGLVAMLRSSLMQSSRRKAAYSNNFWWWYLMAIFEVFVGNKYFHRRFYVIPVPIV